MVALSTVALSLAGTGPVRAAPVTEDHGVEARADIAISLERAIAAGAERGPLVVESKRNREAADAFARSPGSSLPSVPQATLLAGARAPYNLPTGPEVAVTVQQEISLRSLGTARRRAADWAAKAASSDVDRARIEGAATAALAWVDLLEAQGLVRLRATATDDAEKLARIADVRVTSGAATAVERSLARAEVGAARVSVLDGEGRMTEARLALAYATGTSMNESLAANGNLESLATTDVAVTDARAASESAGKHPAVRVAEARAAQAGAEASVARAAAGPTFSLGASAWREGSGDHAAAVIVSIPLPFFDPARYDVGRQSTLAATASNHAARLRSELERDTRLAAHEQTHVREVRAQLRDGVVEPLTSALGTALTAYSAGTSDLGVVLLARRSALAAQERLLIATADVLRADIRVSALGGTLLQGASR